MPHWVTFKIILVQIFTKYSLEVNLEDYFLSFKGSNHSLAAYSFFLWPNMPKLAQLFHMCVCVNFVFISSILVFPFVTYKYP